MVMKDCAATVRSILRELGPNTVWEAFSLHGKRTGKDGFRSLRIYRVIGSKYILVASTQYASVIVMYLRVITPYL
jgi:hypothetical protein